MRTSILRAGLDCSSRSTRANSSSTARCFRRNARIASFADLISSATAPNAARQSAIGRAFSFSPTPNGVSEAKRSANFLRALSAPIWSSSAARSSLSACQRFSSSGAVGGRSGRGERASIAPITTLADASPSTRSDAVSRPGGKSRAISVVSPCGRSTVISRVTVAPSG
jgi:hypothetical protein